MKSKPIIVFDSGFGGISVLKRLVEELPEEDYLYYGDSANAPYGPRSTEKVRELTLNAIAKAKEGCDPKAIVIACNTATAAAKDLLQSTYPEIPVVGILPAVELAASSRKNPQILVLATAGTLKSYAYISLLSCIADGANVVSVAAPEIVEYVEGAMQEREVLIGRLKRTLEPYQSLKFDCVVLGCTHFPFAADVIEEVLGYPVDFFDGSVKVVEQVKALLQRQCANSDQTCSGSVQFVNSAGTQEAIDFARKLLSCELKVKQYSCV